jgi:hypothetical protein
MAGKAILRLLAAEAPEGLRQPSRQESLLPFHGDGFCLTCFYTWVEFSTCGKAALNCGTRVIFLLRCFVEETDNGPA